VSTAAIKDNSVLIAQSQPSIGDTVQFAVDAIHKLRKQGRLILVEMVITLLMMSGLR
jgi:hypothetical protein